MSFDFNFQPGQIIAVAGHRPDKLGGDTVAVRRRLVDLAEWALGKTKPREVIIGMALGWDQAVAQACWSLGIPFVAAIPFAGQERLWTVEQRKRWEALVDQARSFHIVCQGDYAPEKMQRRNEWMVDKARGLVTLHDGSDGGTNNCVRYALKTGCPVLNVWNEWRSMGPGR